VDESNRNVLEITNDEKHYYVYLDIVEEGNTFDDALLTQPQLQKAVDQLRVTLEMAFRAKMRALLDEDPTATVTRNDQTMQLQGIVPLYDIKTRTFALSYVGAPALNLRFITMQVQATHQEIEKQGGQPTAAQLTRLQELNRVGAAMAAECEAVQGDTVQCDRALKSLPHVSVIIDEV